MRDLALIYAFDVGSADYWIHRQASSAQSDIEESGSFANPRAYVSENID